MTLTDVALVLLATSLITVIWNAEQIIRKFKRGFWR
jgi:hypothetical protein